MRVSTGMIYDSGVASINRQTESLLKISQQVSSGRRIVTPSDDPVAAARALEVQQAQDITGQFGTNLNNAKSALGLSDSVLNSVGDLLGRVRQLAVQGGNGSQTVADRRSIAQELRARFDELIGLANSTDGTGQYLFSGYMGDTKPFAGSVATGVTYSGDDGQRRLQVSASRQIEASDSGNDIFNRVSNGNGFFATNFSGTNTGTGVIDAGSVTDPATWNASSRNFQVKFYVDSTTSTTYYDVIDTTANTSLLTGATPPSAPPPYTGGFLAYTSGSAIQIPGAGAQVVITGSPADGDSFSIAPSTSQNVFTTMSNLINALESSQTSTPAGQAAFANNIGFALTNLDQANENVLKVRTSIGSRLNEVDSLDSSNSALSLQYQQTVSNLQDLDYAKAISDLTRNQTNLTAAQKSFQMTAGLSLFNYL